MVRGEQIQRHWNLLKTLQTRGEGIPLRDLADEFDVSERTIQRDFEILQELGFPIEHEDDESGKRFWRMPHDFFRTGPLVMGFTEAVSLHLAERLLTRLAGTLAISTNGPTQGQLIGTPGSAVARYEYDALGRRVRTIEDPEEPDHWTTRHVYP